LIRIKCSQGAAIIRLATESDVEAVLACVEDAYAIYRGTITDMPPVLEGVSEAIVDGCVSILTVDDTLAGALIVAVNGDSAMLENVAVAPGFAGQGLGRRLIEHAVASAWEGGCREMRLNTHAGMAGNVALYEHLGWVVTERQGNRVSMVRYLSD
jgi:GNAT superfamily N-acetyltransferase